jgi:hypothetical protein
MDPIVAAVSRHYPEASVWHVRGRFRDFSTGRNTYSIRSFFVISYKHEEFLIIKTKSPQYGHNIMAGIILSGFTSLVESEYAKKVISSKDWHLLVYSLPKENAQRLMLFQPCQDESSCTSTIESAREVRRQFLAGIKKLVSDLASGVY